jgi:hypothetical protein
MKSTSFFCFFSLVGFSFLSAQVLDPLVLPKAPVTPEGKAPGAGSSAAGSSAVDPISHPLYSKVQGPAEAGFVWKEVVSGYWRKLPADSSSVTASCLNPSAQLQGMLTQEQADAIRVQAEQVGGQPRDSSGREIPLDPPIPAQEAVAPPPYHSYFSFLATEKACLMLPKASLLNVPEALATALLSYDAVSAEGAPKREMVTEFPGPFVKYVRAVPVEKDETGNYVAKAAAVVSLKSPNLILVAVFDGAPVESPVKLIE